MSEFHFLEAARDLSVRASIGVLSLVGGAGYIAEHGASGEELVMSLTFGEKNVGLDGSEVAVGALAIVGFYYATNCIVAQFDNMHIRRSNR